MCVSAKGKRYHFNVHNAEIVEIVAPTPINRMSLQTNTNAHIIKHSTALQ